MKRLNYFQKGVGLLEILIALVISAIMLLAITNMYGIFMQTSNQQKEQSIVQDQANFAFLALKRAVRMSGAGLCVNPIVDEDNFLHQDQEFDNLPSLLTKTITIDGTKIEPPPNFKKLNTASRLHSFSNPTDEDLALTTLKVPKDNKGNPIPTDALLVVYSSSNTRRIIGVKGAGSLSKPSSPYHTRILSTPISETDDLVFYDGKKDTWVMISDCEHTGIFKYKNSDITSIGDKDLPPPKDSSKGFIYNFVGNNSTNQFSLLARLHAKLFFVAKDTQGIPHLYMQDFLAPDPYNKPQPIAAYVQKMTIEYAIPNSDEWKTTKERQKENKWNQKLPIRISLEMSTKKDATPEDMEKFSRVLDIRN